MQEGPMADATTSAPLLLEGCAMRQGERADSIRSATIGIKNEVPAGAREASETVQRV